ncbi:MAG: Flp pilus assembly complex ATPase component TadA [Candidatus Obscuribacterales bacterium]|nr:Flp pilus assembly complex ATPase component TadA [Candidatus Obscuribacterales bacterium]
MECPECAEPINSGAILCRYCGSGISKEFFHECLFCGEMIRKDAVYCRFCKSTLPSNDKEVGAGFARETGPTKRQRPDKSYDHPSPPSEEELERIDTKASRKPFTVKPTPQGKDEREIAAFDADMTLIKQRVSIVIQALERVKFSGLEAWMNAKGSLDEQSRTEVRQLIRTLVDEDEAPLSEMEKGILLQSVLDEVFGFGPLGPVLRDPSVGDICINAPNEIFVERWGRQEKTSVTFESQLHLLLTIDKILLPLGFQFGERNPVVNARLPNGSKVNATMSVNGPTLTIRCPVSVLISLGQHAQKGTMSIQMAEFLKACVFAGINIVVSGPSSSGKTTLVNSLLRHLDDAERVVSIEDKGGELRLPIENWVRLETNIGGTERREIGANRLIENATQMIPNRLVVSQLMGSEAYEYCSAIKSGLKGCLTTVRSDSSSDCIDNLSEFLLMHPKVPSTNVAHRMIGSTIQLIIHIDRLDDGTRRITDVSEVVACSDKVELNCLFKLEQRGIDARGWVRGFHHATGSIPRLLKVLDRERVEYNTNWFSVTSG